MAPSINRSSSRSPNAIRSPVSLHTAIVRTRTPRSASSSPKVVSSQPRLRATERARRMLGTRLCLLVTSSRSLPSSPGMPIPRRLNCRQAAWTRCTPPASGRRRTAAHVARRPMSPRSGPGKSQRRPLSAEHPPGAPRSCRARSAPGRACYASAHAVPSPGCDRHPPIAPRLRARPAPGLPAWLLVLHL